ncbi:MAG: hypothetical protein V7711_05370 [Pseudomonadales bacterium]
MALLPELETATSESHIQSLIEVCCNGWSQLEREQAQRLSGFKQRLMDYIK